MKLGIALICAALTLVVLGVPASAASITILNPSFETPATAGITTPANWVTTGGADSYNVYEFSGPNEFYQGANPTTDPANGGSGYPGVDGENVAFSYEAGGGFSQLLAATLDANSTYSLSIEAFERNGTAYGAPWLGSGLELLAGNTVVASSILNTFGEAPASGSFLTQSVSVDSSTLDQSLIGEQLTVEFFTTMQVTVSNQATDWDDVALSCTGPCVAGDVDSGSVPEPSTLLLFGAGVTAMVRRMRHKFGG